MSENSLDRIKTSKEYETAQKKMGKEQVMEYLKKPDAELEDFIAKNAVFIKNKQDELKNNSTYNRIIEDKKNLEGGLKEALAPYKASVDFCTRILNERKK